MASPGQELETPFLDAVRVSAGEVEAEAPRSLQPGSSGPSSPFLSVYRQEGEAGPGDPESEEMVELLGELYDEELDEVLFELLTEARLFHERHVATEHESPAAGDADSERLLEAHFAPLLHELEAALDHAARRLEGREPATLTEAEVEAAFEEYTPGGDLPPELEHLFGGLKKAFKKVGKKALKYAKKGVKAAATMGFGVLLRKLKPLLKPLLKAVIRRGIRRLPVALRPFAKRLAGRLPFLREVEDAASEEGEAPWSVSELQYELDLQVAHLLRADDEVELERELAHHLSQAEASAGDFMAPLEEARERFVDELLQADDETELAPRLERFIPAAILPALKVGIKVYGRSRLVKQLAKILERILKKFVPKRYRRSLSRALVDAGLRLVHLEVTPEDEERAATEALVATVEDTVRRVAELPEHVLDDEELLEGFALEAFEQAAADYLPQLLAEETYRERPDLRRERRFRGTWIAVPLRRPRYRKFSKIATARISPQKAKAVATYGGETLAEFFQDRLGMAPGEEVEARVHLYELGAGTLLSEVAHHERSVPGLGSLGGAGYAQLHPLTPEAAGLLLDEPELGREASPGALADRKAIGAGQRVYYLEVEGARPQAVTGPAGGRELRRPTQVDVVLDFPAAEVTVRLFLGEATAQRLAVELRRGGSAGAVLPALSGILRPRLRAALLGRRHGGVRILHGAVTPEQGRGAALQRIPSVLLSRFAETVTVAVERGLGNHLRDHPQHFVAATEDPEDGLTLEATLASPPGLGLLGRALHGRPSGLRDASGEVEAHAVRFRITPGAHRG